MYNLNWKEIRITRQIKFDHIIGFRIIPEAATGGVRKKGVLKNFANFTGKNLYRNLLLTKLQVWKLFFKNPYFEKDLRTTASVINKVSVNPKDNGFTVPGNYIIVLCHSGTPPQTSQILPDFVRLLWMMASRVIAKDKNTFSVSIKITILASIDVILMTFLGNDVTNQK